jgi:hypothetical protein
MVEMIELAKIAIRLTQIVMRQQVEIRELRGSLHAYETKVHELLSTNSSRELHKEAEAQTKAAQGAALDDLTRLISELHALLPTEMDSQ